MINTLRVADVGHGRSPQIKLFPSDSSRRQRCLSLPGTVTFPESATSDVLKSRTFVTGDDKIRYWGHISRPPPISPTAPPLRAGNRTYVFPNHAPWISPKSCVSRGGVIAKRRGGEIFFSGLKHTGYSSPPPATGDFWPPSGVPLSPPPNNETQYEHFCCSFFFSRHRLARFFRTITR